MEWPKPNERLFVLGDDWQHNACISSYWGSLSTYAGNYKAGAVALVHSAAENRTTLDAVIYPIVFLYRQYIELCLKDIIFLCRRLKQDNTGFPQHHNLSTLWDEAKQLLVAHYGSDVPAEMQNLDSCIADFATHDPNSFAFRYPWDKKGNRTLQNLRHINLRNLYETMERVGSFLDCMTGDLGERLQACYEMERDSY